MNSKKSRARGYGLIEFLVALAIFTGVFMVLYGVISLMLTQIQLSRLEAEMRDGATSELHKLQALECTGSDPDEPNPLLTVGDEHEKDVTSYQVPMTIKWNVFREETDPNNHRVYVYRIELTPYLKGTNWRSRMYYGRMICTQ